MTEYLKGLFGAGNAAPSPSPASDDADFADFAGAPDPSPASISPVTPSAASSQSAIPTSSLTPIVYTKWYRVWERTSPRDFYQEAFVIPFILVICALHYWGRRTNRAKVKGWVRAHAPELEKEFSTVGFIHRRTPSVDEVQSSGLAKAMAADGVVIPQTLLREKTASEFHTYASGRQNTAFMDIKVRLFKRYNPMTLLVEYIFSFLFDSAQPPAERMEATAYTFDGKEKDLVPKSKDGPEVKGTQSSYESFVFAIVNKDLMRSLREDRYDISLTSTKDNEKLPIWATTMSEAAEITQHMITPELAKAVEQAGDAFEYLIVTDQPLDKPTKLDETKPKKRVSLSLRLPSSSSPDAYKPTLPIFTYFLRLPDFLASSGRYRPEVQNKIRKTRETEITKLKKADEGEKAEERRLESEKKKKEMRDNRVKGLSAEEQRKFLEREREKGQKKQEKKMSRKA